jgi:hypothetical protein
MEGNLLASVPAHASLCSTVRVGGRSSIWIGVWGGGIQECRSRGGALGVVCFVTLAVVLGTNEASCSGWHRELGHIKVQGGVLNGLLAWVALNLTSGLITCGSDLMLLLLLLLCPIYLCVVSALACLITSP